MSFNPDGTIRFITVEQLRKRLEKLPDRFLVTPNPMSNLVILNEEEVYQGYLDLRTQELVLYDEETNESIADP